MILALEDWKPKTASHNLLPQGSECLLAIDNNDTLEVKPFEGIRESFFKFASKHSHQGCISKEEQTEKECDWTDLLQKVLEYGNEYALQRFQYGIRFDECQIIGCFASATQEVRITINSFEKIEISVCDACSSRLQLL